MNSHTIIFLTLKTSPKRIFKWVNRLAEDSCTLTFSTEEYLISLDPHPVMVDLGKGKYIIRIEGKKLPFQVTSAEEQFTVLEFALENIHRKATQASLTLKVSTPNTLHDWFKLVLLHFQQDFHEVPSFFEKKDEKQEKSEIHKGRYRLTEDDNIYRHEIVEKANKIRSDNPLKTWREIAREIDKPERTLRDWRHNNY